MRESDAAEDWLDGWAAAAGTRARLATEMARQVSRLSGSAGNHDDTIRVTVGSGGQVLSIDIGDRARELTGRELSAQLMATIGRAQARLAGAVVDTVEQTVGADTETGRAVIGSFATRFPEPPEAPDER
ncbi:hypothetical protein ACWKSP_22815 [Micromonosporaceae bacterium Da 78-11]